MGTSTVHFELGQDGTMTRVDTNRNVIKPTEDFYRVLASGQSMRVGNMGKVDDKAITVYGSSPHCGASVRLSSIHFHCPFRMVGESHYTPDFKANVSSVKMKLKWEIPENLHVRLGFLYTPYQDSGELHEAGYIDIFKAYLFALANNNSTYRLPIANNYDTSEMCLGSFTKAHASVADAMIAVLNQFNNSTWNADLWSTPAESEKMFRWKPDNEAMTQLPIDGDPLGLCMKVGVREIKLLMP